MSVYPYASQPVWWLRLSAVMGKCTSLLLCFVKVVLTENILTTHYMAFILSRRHKFLTSRSRCNLQNWVLLLCLSLPNLLHYHQPLSALLHTCSSSAPCSTVVSHWPSDIAWSHCCAIDGKIVTVRLKESWLQLTFLYKFGAINFIGDL